MKIKIAFLNNRYGTTRSVREAFQRSGHEIILIETAQKRVSDIHKEIESCNPDFIFSSNFHVSDPDSSESIQQTINFVQTSRRPLAVWMYDNPLHQLDIEIQKALMASPPQNHLYFVNDKFFSSTLSLWKLPSVHLPLGVNREIFLMRNAGGEASWVADLRFTGQPLISCRLQDITIESLRAGHKNLYLQELKEMATRSDCSENEITSTLEKISVYLDLFFETYFTTPMDYNRAEQNFYTSIKESCSPEMTQTAHRLFGRLSSLYSWWQMTSYLTELLPEGLIVQGSPVWKEFFPQQAEEFRRLSWPELFASYRATKINFCFTKWSLPTAIHERVFEIYLAGGFPLTDNREELALHFEKDEVVSYRTIDEAKDLIRYFTPREAERRQFIEKGTTRVLESHTFDHRIPVLVRSACEHWNIR
ncbi:MAG: CgeB family protein [Bacteriovoracaceae bacterium]|nr:CgeB family protein [Bacteriovoracaceae bacterium]